MAFLPRTTLSSTSVEIVSSLIGGPALLRCDLDFPGGLVYPYTVHWYKQGQENHIFLRQEGKPPIISDEYSGRLFLIGASLNITQVHNSDFGLYECRVFVERRNIQNSSWVLLEVQDQGLRFIDEPKSVLLLPGASHVLNCWTEPSTDIQWKFNGQFLQPDEKDGIHFDKNQLTLSSKLDDSTLQSLEGSYQCVAVLGNLGLGSHLAEISVAEPFSHSNNITLTKQVGSEVLIPCNPPRSVPEGILRIENIYGSHIGPSDHVQLLSKGVFKIPSVTWEDAGTYQCTMENTKLNTKQKSNYFIQLNVVAEIDNKPTSPELIVSPDNFYAVQLGSNLSLHCYAEGDPPPVISWTKYGGRLLNGRYSQNSGTLSLYNIQKEDDGTYVCQADNDIPIPVSTYTIVEIKDQVKIIVPLGNLSVNEGSEVVFDCNATGVPNPVVTWLHNGVDIDFSTEGAIAKDNRLILRSTSISSAGFYQCFATNPLGTEYSTARLRILPQLKDKVEPTLKPHVPKNVTESPDDAGNLIDEQHQHKKRIHHKKYNKKTNQASNGETLMVPPTSPQVTKLSDESVMVRWEVPENNGLAIQFFKVQYKDVSKNKPRWMTIDDEIAPHINSFEVPNLKTGHAYRFRIAAVYSNNDNNQGPVSGKFTLHKDPKMRKPTVGPNIIRLEAVSPSAILLHWQYMLVDYVPVEGFFVYYRATTTAAYYTKTTVMGSNSRSHIISFLLPDTTYEIKMQCFNEAGTSDFSNISIQKTPKSEEQTSGMQETRVEQFPPVVTTQQSNRETMYMAIGAVLGSVIIVLLVSMVYCNWKQRQQRRQLLATLDETIRGHNDMELSSRSPASKREMNGILPNGHQISVDGNFTEPFLNNNIRETEMEETDNSAEP
uniref:Interference hedgehog n=1 Tax=Strigamia maritima TaxID=126957 RepID=T1J590_STRMM